MYMKKKLNLAALLLAAAFLGACGGQKQDAADTVAQTESAETENADQKSSIDLADGVYTVDFKTDSSMFKVNESKNGKGVLTVKDGEATLHISLTSKNIVNLYLGTADEAKEDEAGWLQPTVDTVTYSDGLSEEVNGFDVPVPALGEEFDLALIGKKGTWYDHKVKVENPVSGEAEDAEAASSETENSDDAAELVRRGVLPQEKCVVIAGSGIDLNTFPYSEVCQENTFFLATRLLVTKGVRTYFEAAKIVKEKHPEAKFYLAGSLDPNPDGINKDELDQYVQDGTVEYLGVVKDMPAALKEYAVFVLPSYYREGVPHAILEAMSIGRAIITTDAPGCKETINGKNGFLIEPRNSEQLAEKMIWMIEHPAEVKQMGMESRKYAEEKFDVEKVNQVMLETMGIQ